MDDPEAALRGLYERMGVPMRLEAINAMQAYIAGKPKGKHGIHTYDIGADAEIARQRALYRRYQDRFDVPDEH